MRPLPLFLAVCLAGGGFLSSCASPSHGPDLLQRMPKGRSLTLTRAPGDPACAFERINDIWSVTIHQPAAIAPGSSITFAGWAVDEDRQSLASGVDLVIDGLTLAADYGGEREDVAGYFKTPQIRDSAFCLFLPAGWLAKGRHSVSIRVISGDGRTYREGAPIAFIVP
jgi:hypothetical protein